MRAADCGAGRHGGSRAAGPHLPRLLKLLRSVAFKAKPAHISLISTASATSGGGAASTSTAVP
jgi:hypothetical protein